MARTELNNAGLRPLYSFDQLVIGPNNHVAVAACHEVAKRPGEAYNPLFLFGPSGVGKTHLMQAVANRMVEENPQGRVRYISAERFISEVLTAMSEDKVLELRRSYGSLELLIIDDVQYLMESKVSQEELFHIFNNMHEQNHQLILAADRPPTQLTALNKNVRSRLEWGLATDIKVPDENTRLEILRKKQSLQGLQLTDEMLLFAARALSSNVRELEGFLKRIHAYVTLSHQTISTDLVVSVVRELLPEGTDLNAVLAQPAAAPAPPASAPPPAPPPPPMAAPPSLTVPPSAPVAPPAYTNGRDNGHQNGHHKAPPAPEMNPFDEFPEPVEPARPPASPPPAAVAPPAKPPAPREPAPPPSTVSFDQLLESIDMTSDEPAAPSPAPLAKAARAPESPAAPPAPPKRPPIELPPEVIASGAAEEPAPTEIAAEEETGELPSGHKEIGAVLFYPSGCMEALETVHRKFQEVIKKHKLKFRLRRVHDEPYSVKGKINYSSFVDVCKANRVPVAIVIGPPPETHMPEQDFYDLLAVTLDVQGVSLQLVNWGEINKDYRYLNLALDIALVRSR